MKRAALSILLTAMVAASCSSSGDDASPSTEPATTEPSTTEPVDTEPVDTDPVDDAAVDPLDVEFSSDPIDAGPLFGSSSAGATESDSATDSAEECAAEDCGSDPIDAPEPEPRIDFQPAAADAPFCTLFADLDGRPFPSDELEAAQVASVWIGELRKVAVEDTWSDLDLLLEFLDGVLESNGQLSLNDSDADVLDAADRLSDYVDTNCNGLGEVDQGSTTVESPQSPVEGAGIVPDVDFEGPARDTPLPLFGSSDVDELPTDFQRSAEHVVFCGALDDIATRPQPVDDYEQIVVADQYLAAIAPVSPEVILVDLERLQSWTAAIVAEGEFTDELEVEFIESEIGEGAARIDDFVDTNCNGL